MQAVTGSFGLCIELALANQRIRPIRTTALKLSDCVITAVAHCAPPQNTLKTDEIANCRCWLKETIDLVQPTVLLALGLWRGEATVSEARFRGWQSGRVPPFKHHARVQLQGDHCSSRRTT